MPTKILPESGRGRVARNNDIIQLYHPGTDSYLLTHDVASPLTTTNQEYTTWPKDDLTARYNDTKFRIVLNDGHEGEPLKTKSGWFKLVHVATGVSLQVGGALPDWGYKQQELNGKKDLPEKATTWFVEEILMDECMSALLRCARDSMCPPDADLPCPPFSQPASTSRTARASTSPSRSCR